MSEFKLEEENGLECPLCLGEDVEIDMIYAGNSDKILGMCIACPDCETELSMYGVNEEKILRVWNSMMDL